MHRSQRKTEEMKKWNITVRILRFFLLRTNISNITIKRDDINKAMNKNNWAIYVWVILSIIEFGMKSSI